LVKTTVIPNLIGNPFVILNLQNKMKTIFKHNALTLIAILLLSFSYAQEVSFTAITSNNTVKTGGTFRIEFETNQSMSNFKPPKFTNFRVLSGPHQSNSTLIVNGKVKSSITISYNLMAIKEGSFTVGPAVASIKGKAYKTNSIKIKVGKGVKVKQGGNQNSKTTSGGNVSSDMYVKCFVNKTKPYKGEQIIVTYKLYTRLSNIVGAGQTNQVQLDGFWKQDVDIGRIQLNEEKIIGGYRWRIGTLKKVILFPQRSGNLELDPFEYQVIVQKRVQGGQSFFDQLYRRVENVEYNIKSKSLKIKVLDLPAGAPKGFSGAVGKLNMEVDVSTTEIKANEAVNIKIKIAGKGNLPLLNSPEITFPSDFETYDPKINENIKTESSGVSGSKEFDYLVIPRHAGQFKLDPVVFSYFNPSTKKYHTITSNPIEINVLKNDGSTSDNVIYSSNKEDIQMLGEDIRYIHTNNIQFSHSNETFYGSWKFYLLLLIAPVLFILTRIFRNRIRVANSDVIGMKKKKASKIAGKLLASAKQSLATNNKNAFYEDISKALFGYIGNKLNIAVAELNQSNIKEQLTNINVSEQTSNELMDTIELCDMARFAPVSISEQEVYDKAEAIINQIEQEVKV